MRKPRILLVARAEEAAWGGGRASRALRRSRTLWRCLGLERGRAALWAACLFVNQPLSQPVGPVVCPSVGGYVEASRDHSPNR